MFSSSEMILLSGDKAQLVRVQVQKTMEAKEFLENIDIKKDSYTTPLLPRGTIQYISHKDRAMVVMEQAPKVCTFYVQNKRELAFQVAIPWQIYIAEIHLSQNTIRPTYLFFRPAPVRDLKDDLFIPWLGNQYHDRDHSLCLGHDDDTNRIEIGRNGETIRQRLETLVSHVQNSSFNDSLAVSDKLVPIELKAVDPSRRDGEQMHADYYRMAMLNPCSYKYLALAHLFFMRNQATKQDHQICSDVCGWEMKPYKSLLDFINKFRSGQ